MTVQIRPERTDDHEAIRDVVRRAFTGHPDQVADLVDLLRSTGHARVSLVACEENEVVGHVLLSRSWVDATDRVVEVLVLSPLGVVPERQRSGIGSALVAAALEAARGLGAPAVFLEGDPDYYSRRGFERASAHGFTRPSVRIPDAACQVALLDAHEASMTGALVYCDPFWQLDCVGLRGERLARVEARTADPARLAVILLVDRRGHVLLQERDELAPRAANQWGMVGGHVEDDEDFEPAAYRELEEETGLALPPGSLELWREDDFSYSDGHRGHYRVYVAGVDLTDDDIVVGEGRQIVFVDPDDVDGLDRSESCAHFVPSFLASATYRGLLR